MLDADQALEKIERRSVGQWHHVALHNDSTFAGQVSADCLPKLRKRVIGFLVQSFFGNLMAHFSQTST